MKQLICLFILCVASTTALADGITVNAGETVIGRFHRIGNKVHAYGETHAWRPLVLADMDTIVTPIVVKNSDDNYSIFFSNLKELFQAMADLSKSTGQKIRVFNLNAHGMPGGVWFPRDAADLKSRDCAQWRDVADSDDDVSYEQYYSGVDKAQIQQIRQVSKVGDVSSFGCVNGLSKWKRTAQEVPAVKTAFAADAQINFLSCTVGLGNAGTAFTKGVGEALLGAGGVVRTAIKFGLGDWSMPMGMGFWDYISDEQLRRDNKTYPETKEDALIYQRGDVRVAHQVAGAWVTAISADQDFMYLSFVPISSSMVYDPVSIRLLSVDRAPMSVRIPGTNVRATRAH